MKTKKITLLIASFLLIGIAFSGLAFGSGITYIGEINPLSEIEIGDFIAGTETSAEFEFEFTDNINAADHFPLIYEISFSNSSEEIPEVWKNDFEIKSGTVAREIWGYEFREITLECNDEFPLTINHRIGSETISSAENGTFYCYNTTEGTWDNLKKHNKVSLDITTHPALYPGDYNLTAKMFYLNDSYAPKLRFVDESYFDRYFTDGDEVSFEVEIIDPYLENYQAKIIRENQQNISFIGSEVVGKTDIYGFVHQSISIAEGNYPVQVSAEDFNGNVNEIETIVKIDNTPPEIEFVGPTGVVSDNFTIKFNVTDEKAGVDNESVKARLREIINGQICPTTGGYLGDNETPCTTTSWIDLTLNETSRLFEVEINTTEYNLTSNEYWLDATALDILGNKADWVA